MVANAATSIVLVTFLQIKNAVSIPHHLDVNVGERSMDNSPVSSLDD